MKTLKWVLLLAALALLLGATARPSVAAGPTNTFPGGGFYIDNQNHTIPANTSLWYRFDYAGDRSQVIVTLVNGTNSGLAFKVYTPAQISDWWETPPIGRGTPPPLNCDNLKPQLYGQCKGLDLRWWGNFNASGTYYVQVVNHTSSDLNLLLTIEGTGVTPVPPAPSTPLAPAVPAGTPEATPSPVATPAPNTGLPVPGSELTANVDPQHAYLIDGLVHTIVANNSLWFRFGYAGDRSQIIVTLLNAANSGLAFNVYTPAQISDWWEIKPIGRGTIEMLDCDTGKVTYVGQCPSDYLRWTGQFNAAGTYYVELINHNSGPTTFDLTIAGNGVSLSQ